MNRTAAHSPTTFFRISISRDFRPSVRSNCRMRGPSRFPPWQRFSRAYVCFHSDEAELGTSTVVSADDLPEQKEIDEIPLISSPLLELHSMPEESAGGRFVRLMHIFAPNLEIVSAPQPGWQLYVFRRSH